MHACELSAARGAPPVRSAALVAAATACGIPPTVASVAITVYNSPTVWNIAIQTAQLQARLLILDDIVIYIQRVQPFNMSFDPSTKAS